MFAAYNGDAIWGTGETEELARADVMQWVDADTHAQWVADLDVAQMTKLLEAEVENRGGAISFGLLPDGRIGTYDESYEAQ